MTQCVGPDANWSDLHLLPARNLCFSLEQHHVSGRWNQVSAEEDDDDLAPD